MNAEMIIQDLSSLPPEAQKQVEDLIKSLKSFYSAESLEKKSIQTKLSLEPFVGMWKDREDMKDSTAWVQNLREQEWKT